MICGHVLEAVGLCALRLAAGAVATQVCGNNSEVFSKARGDGVPGPYS